MPAHLVSTVYGPMLIPPSDRYIGAALSQLGAYCADELAAWLPYVPVGGTVVDVGANLGSHTLGFAQAVGDTGQVIAVEPQRHIYHMLCGSIALCGARQVIAKQIACGRALSTLPLACIDYDQPNNFGGLNLGRHPNPHVLHDTIQVEPIDAWKLERLDCLKIDVEGMEMDVLMGAEQTIARCRPMIVAEWSTEDRLTGFDAPIVQWLTTRGYDVYQQATPLGDPWPGIGSFNIVAISSGSAAPTHATISVIEQPVPA